MILRRFRLRRLYAERTAAQAAYNACVARKDTRGQHHALKRLKAAVVACMRAEV